MWGPAGSRVDPAHALLAASTIAAAFGLVAACGPKDFEESSRRPDTGEPFGGVARGGSGPSGVGGGGGDCGDVTEVGTCAGDTIAYCENGMLLGGNCRDLDPSCSCGFNEEAGVNDCLCAGGSGGSGGGSGTGGTGGTGGMCSGNGDPCQNQSECCTDSRCVSFDEQAPLCAASCNRNAQCASGCCAPLNDFSGACGPIASCGGSGCRQLGNSCDTALDCCAIADGISARCVDFGAGGPRLCSAPCSGAADCVSNCCLTDGSGVRACFPAEFCL